MKENIGTGIMHTFVVCAYKESPYLEDCIQSLIRQNVKSDIYVSTSTPNDYIQRICQKYKIDLWINNEEKGIAGDWNFAYKNADTPLVTIAHQDDIYAEGYAEKMIQAYQQKKSALILFSGYGELRNGQTVLHNKLLRIKKIMLLPLRISILQRSIFIRRRILSLGNPICCPAVTYAKENLPDIIFRINFKSNVDWEAWEILSKKRGQFVYLHEPLMFHRIHEESTTSDIIADNMRSKEDFEIMKKFWPEKIAGLIAGIYKKSENSNDVTGN